MQPGPNSTIPEDTRQESFCDMLKFACCPNFQWKSFIVLITAFEVFVFVISLFYGGVQEPNRQYQTPTFLQIPLQTLDVFGAKWPRKMKESFEIWRFVMPMFLHANFSHLFFNCFSQVIFGSRLENKHGTSTLVWVYFLSGLGGVVFSSLVSDSISVGASTAIYGLMGSYAGALILNWRALDFEGSPRN